jgi:hypothetical protein
MTDVERLRRAFERGYGKPVDWSCPVTERDLELGRAFLAEIIGGELTYENIMLWYARERQKQRQQIRLVSDKAKP